MPDSRQQLIDKAAAGLLAYEAAPSVEAARAAWWAAAEAHLLVGATEDEILTRAVLLGRETTQGPVST